MKCDGHSFIIFDFSSGRFSEFHLCDESSGLT